LNSSFDKDEFVSVIKIMFALTNGNSKITEILRNINVKLGDRA
jgi:hypothetical protein